MKKHFKKLMEFLLFGVPLIIRVLLKMKNQNHYHVEDNFFSKCSRCGTSTHHISGVCAVCRELDTRAKEKEDRSDVEKY